MQTTPNYNLKKIESTDEILTSLTHLSENVEVIDEILFNKANSTDVEIQISSALEDAKLYTDEHAGGTTIILDDSVSSDSQNGVKSSGIYNAIQNSVNIANENINTALNQKIQCGTTDLEAGVSELATGTIYLVYE